MHDTHVIVQTCAMQEGIEADRMCILGAVSQQMLLGNMEEQQQQGTTVWSDHKPHSLAILSEALRCDVI